MADIWDDVDQSDVNDALRIASPDLSHLPGATIGPSQPYLSMSEVPTYSGAILPYRKYADNSIKFDLSAGLPGVIGRFFTAPGRAASGDYPVFEVNEEGETVPSQQAIGEALNFAGNIMGGGVPASALERSGGMMLGTSGTRMVPETAAVQLAKRELSPVGLYSHGAEAAMALPQATGSVDQMIAMLRKQPGVTEAELRNAGLLTSEGQVNPEWLAKGKIGREDIASHLQSRLPQVEETVLGYIPDYKQSEMAIDNWLKENYYKRLDDAADELGIDQRTLRNQILEDENNFKNIKSSKYEQYTLPGGENYREVLLRFPKQKSLDLIAKEKGYGGWGDHLTPEQKNELLAINQGPDFRTGHWDDPNVLAHIRMADRTGPNGEKILHVEEVQSDWGQQGKKAGFSTLENIKKIEDMKNEVKNLGNQYNDLRLQYLDMQPKSEGYGLPSYRPENYDPKIEASIKQQMDSINNKIKEIKNNIPDSSGLPSAPYVTSTQGWTDLALKRILKEAAEGGYDKVVWTPGAEQAGRYDLSKQISELELVHNKNGEGKLTFVDKNLIPHQQDVKGPEHLAELVGKDLAEKLYEKSKQNNGMARLAGLDLSVGGEGMKEYYDKILPNRLQSVAKKHDKNAKVQYTDVMLPPSGKQGTNNPPIQAPGLDITPQMRESILRGQGAFKRGGKVSSLITNRALQLANEYDQ